MITLKGKKGNLILENIFQLKKNLSECIDVDNQMYLLQWNPSTFI